MYRKGMGAKAFAVLILLLVLGMFSGGIGTLIFSLGIADQVNVATDDVELISKADFYTEFLEEHYMERSLELSEGMAAYRLGEGYHGSNTVDWIDSNEWNQSSNLIKASSEIEEQVADEAGTIYNNRYESSGRAYMQDCYYTRYDFEYEQNNDQFRLSADDPQMICSTSRSEVRMDITNLDFTYPDYKAQAFGDTYHKLQELVRNLRDDLPDDPPREEADKTICWDEFESDIVSEGEEDHEGNVNHDASNYDDYNDDKRDEVYNEARDAVAPWEYHEEFPELEDHDQDRFQLNYEGSDDQGWLGRHNTGGDYEGFSYSIDCTGIEETHSCSEDNCINFGNETHPDWSCWEEHSASRVTGDGCDTPNDSYTVDNPSGGNAHEWHGWYRLDRVDYDVELEDTENKILTPSGAENIFVDVNYWHNFQEYP